MCLRTTDQEQTTLRVDHDAAPRGGVYSASSLAQASAALQKTVAALNRISRGSSLAFALEVGKVVVDQCYGGDVRALRSRAAKTTSLRALANHPDLAISPTVLYRCVATYELCARVGGVSAWKHLTASHLRAVLGLAASEQVQLLNAAERETWSVVALEQAASRCRAAQRSRGGRKPISHAMRRLSSLHKSSAVLSELANGELPPNLSADAVRRLECEVCRVARDCQRILERLRSSLPQELSPAATPGDGS